MTPTPAAAGANRQPVRPDARPGPSRSRPPPVPCSARPGRNASRRRSVRRSRSSPEDLAQVGHARRRRRYAPARRRRLGRRAAPVARIALLAGIAGLTAASERVSFTKVIARTPALNWLDTLGRRPAEQPPPAPQLPQAHHCLSGQNRQGEHARSRTGGQGSAAGRGDCPGRRADRRDHHARAGHRVGRRWCSRTPSRRPAWAPRTPPRTWCRTSSTTSWRAAPSPRWRAPVPPALCGPNPRQVRRHFRRAARAAAPLARPGQPDNRGHRAAAGIRRRSAGRPAARGPKW